MSQRTSLEVMGKPGQIAGAFVLPMRGRIALRIIDDHLRVQIKLAGGLETQEILIKSDRIESVQVTEGRIWWLLWVGLITLIWIIGIAFIVAFFLVKQRWIIIYSGRQTVILFFTEREMSNVRTFAQALVAKPKKLPPAPPKRQDSSRNLEKHP